MRIFKRLFKQEEKLKININNVERFIEKQKNKLNEESNIIKNEIKSKKIRLFEYLAELNNKDLYEPQIVPDRAKTIFYDNKKQYVQKVNLFLNNLDTPEDNIELYEYLHKVTNTIQELEQDTKRNFYICSEFLQTDMQKIAKKIQDLEKTLINGITYFEKHKINLLQEVYKLKQKHDLELKEIDDFSKEIELIEETKLNIYSKKDEYLQKIKEIKTKPAYLELKSIQVKIQELEKELEVAEKKYSDLKSDLQSFNNKFSRNKEDINFESQKEVEQLENLINQTKSDKTIKAKKTLDKLKEIDLNKLNGLKEEFNTLKKREINNSANLNLKEITGRIEQLDQAIKIENNKIVEASQKIEKIRPKLTKQKIRDIVKEINPDVEMEL
jgi:hypothetical protein